MAGLADGCSCLLLPSVPCDILFWLKYLQKTWLLEGARLWVTFNAKPELASRSFLKLICNLESKIPVDELFKLYTHVRMRVKKGELSCEHP